MNWEAIGAVGEVGGAIAVVFTLGYLAVQIRQNTRTTQFSAIQAMEQGVSNTMAAWTSSVENAVLVTKGLNAYETLSEDEQMFLQLLIRRLLLGMDANYWAFTKGILPPELWEREAEVLRRWVNSAGGRVAWERGGFSAPFREYVGRELLEREIAGAGPSNPVA